MSNGYLGRYLIPLLKWFYTTKQWNAIWCRTYAADKITVNISNTEYCRQPVSGSHRMWYAEISMMLSCQCRPIAISLASPVEQKLVAAWSYLTMANKTTIRKFGPVTLTHEIWPWDATGSCGCRETCLSTKFHQA